MQNLFDQGFKQPLATRLLQSNGLESLHGSLEFVCARRDQAVMREYLATVHRLALTHHDQLVTCVQSTLTDLADRLGEQAVFDSIEHTSRVLWSPRMANWFELSLSERVWLSAEAMRGHLSGPGRRGELRVFDESEAIVLELDPCGCCGVLRRGETLPAGNLEPHVWTGQRTGFGWYATHVLITMMYLPLRSGSPPYRAFEQCDTALACRWLIEKVPASKHAHHAAQMGLPTTVQLDRVKNLGVS